MDMYFVFANKHGLRLLLSLFRTSKGDIMEENTALRALVLAQQRTIDEQAQRIGFLETTYDCTQCIQGNLWSRDGLLYFGAAPLLREDFPDLVLDITPQPNGLLIRRHQFGVGTLLPEECSITFDVPRYVRSDMLKDRLITLYVAFSLCDQEWRNTCGTLAYLNGYRELAVCAHAKSRILETLYAFAADWRKSHQNPA